MAETQQHHETDDLVTGEAVALQLPAATIGLRVASGLIDITVQVVLLLVAMLLAFVASLIMGFLLGFFLLSISTTKYGSNLQDYCY